MGEGLIRGAGGRSPVPKGRQTMKSKGDPILDLQSLCGEQPLSEDDLKIAYEKLGWGPPFNVVFGACNGIYIEKRADGLYHKRGENTQEQLDAVYDRAREKGASSL
jgi:hypothetical protein